MINKLQAIALFVFSLISHLSLVAQESLQGLNYQAVARNASGGVVASQSIKVRFSVRTGSSAGPVQYAEAQATTTTAQGLFTLVIGKGTAQTGTFAGINWTTANHYLQTEIDVSGGNNFVSIGTTPLYSVPFALYAANNMVGPQGPQGATGLQGPQGIQGPAGNTWNINSTAFNTDGTLAITTTNSPTTITSSNAAWLANGNQNTNPANQFLGTTDAQPLIIKTANVERMRFLNGPQIAINRTSAPSNILFSVFGSGYPGTINPPLATTNYPIGGYSTGGFAGIYGENNQNGQGVWGLNTSNGTGVLGASTSGNGVTGTSSSGSGVYGTSSGINTSAVLGSNTYATAGAGVMAVANNYGAAIIPAEGAGLAALGNRYGAYSIGVSHIGVKGIGVMGIGGATSPTAMTFILSGYGTGLVGNGSEAGVAGIVTSGQSGNGRWGGFFGVFDLAGGVTGPITLVAGTGATNTQYGLISTGTKSTIVKDEQGRNRSMFCTEAPEVLFQDFGAGQLQNGFVHITLDPLLVRNVYVDEKHPLKVFIQLEGDCKGIFVSNKTSNGFDVQELQGGQSNVSFTWQIVAARADSKDEGGKVISLFSTLRFPLSPEFPKIEPVKLAPEKLFETKTAIPLTNKQK
jgi:hypothetical protein